MRPDQCGTGRNLADLHPGDRAAIEWFSEFLRVRQVATEHRVAVEQIMTGATRLQLEAGPPFHARDLVKITEGRHAGRWGYVTRVEDYRDLHKVGVDNSHLLSFLVMVALFTHRRGGGLEQYPPGPIPFEPYELEPLFADEGDWVKCGRVVSRQNWPRARTGTSEAS